MVVDIYFNHICYIDPSSKVIWSWQSQWALIVAVTVSFSQLIQEIFGLVISRSHSLGSPAYLIYWSCYGVTKPSSIIRLFIIIDTKKFNIMPNDTSGIAVEWRQNIRGGQALRSNLSKYTITQAIKYTITSREMMNLKTLSVILAINVVFLTASHCCNDTNDSANMWDCTIHNSRLCLCYHFTYNSCDPLSQTFKKNRLIDS